MDDKRLKCIVGVLNRYELTLLEKQFVERVKKYFDENGKLTEQQESILEGIFRGKKWISQTFCSPNNHPKGSSSKAA